ncbi:putative peptidoglycan lipid II flippase [Anaerolineae bacterium]|nr:putative peptidoglycan lipid II flippase [Anaerolineae bacterium]
MPGHGRDTENHRKSSMIKKLLSFGRYSLLSGVALILGFGRELTVSATFGLSKELDVYLAISGFFIFFGTQISNALEMVFVSKSALLDSAERVTAQFFKLLKVLLFLNLAVLTLLYGASGHLIAWIFPGLDQGQRELGVLMLSWLLVAIVLANVSGLIRACLNVLRIFSPGMLAGSIISLSSIIAMLLFGDDIGIRALLYGFIIGNALVFIMNTFFFLRVADFSYRQRLPKDKGTDHGVWKAVSIVLIGEVAFQGFSMTEKSFSSTFEKGTLSAFFYAWTLVNVPLSLVVMPLSTVLYPRLAEAFGKDRRQGYAIFKRYGGLLFVFGLAVVAILSLFSEIFVKLIFMRGNFSESDAEKTARILSVLIFSLPLMSLSRLSRYSLYSLSNYSGPVLALALSWLVIAGMAWLLIPEYGVLGLACASTLAVATEALAMFFILRVSLGNAKF